MKESDDFKRRRLILKMWSVVWLLVNGWMDVVVPGREGRIREAWVRIYPVHDQKLLSPQLVCFISLATQ